MIMIFSALIFILSFTSISALYSWEEECPKIIKFWSYTEKPTTDLVYNPLDLKSAEHEKFEKNTPIKVILHGYGASPNVYHIRNLISVYLNTGFHVIAVDYEQITSYPDLFKTKSVLGKCAAELLLRILEKNPDIRLEQFHIIGFSVGAQIAAQISNHIGEPNKLERITGLDPTWVLFDTNFIEEKDSLNKNHANFVDIIHTDIIWAGCSYNEGHFDFYVNGGLNQPISEDRSDHSMAVEFFTQTVEKKLSYSIHKMNCSIWKWHLGWCEMESNYSMQIEFGEHAIKPFEWEEGSYIVYTDDRRPQTP